MATLDVMHQTIFIDIIGHDPENILLEDFTENTNHNFIIKNYDL
jgi:hypothetical protein